MNFHFFTDNEYAGPGPLDALKFWDYGGYTLRHLPRNHLPIMHFPNTSQQINFEIANLSDSAEISVFWNDHYTGDDWRFICSPKDVERWQKTGFVLVIKHDSVIVGTFVCHYLKGIFSGAYNKQAALLDGLVIHPKFRGKGLASFLLASMDYYIYRQPDLDSAALIWFREHDSRWNAGLQTPISILEYSYAKIHELPRRNRRAGPAEKNKVEKIVKTIYESCKSEFTLALDFTTDEDIYWFFYKNTLVGIVNTHRISKDDFVILEVVFAANIINPYFHDLLIAIEQSAHELPFKKAVIFMSNSKSRGNISRPPSPWVTGKSGFLTTHLYNWMPPKFLGGDILFPFSCI